MSGAVNLIRGDCLDEMAKLDAESVDLVCTDPPYRIVTGGDNGNCPQGMLSGNRKLFTHQNDIDIGEWMPLVYRVLKQCCHAYVFTNCLNLQSMMAAALGVGFKLHNILVWEKNNCTPSQYYMKNCEYVLFLRKGRAKWINNIGESKTVHRFDNIIGNKTHPCEKPVDLLKFYIQNSTEEGNIVLDPFMGTGSCAMACKETNRSFIGIEKDERYFAIAKKRIEDEQTKPVQEVLAM